MPSGNTYLTTLREKKSEFFFRTKQPPVRPSVSGCFAARSVGPAGGHKNVHFLVTSDLYSTLLCWVFLQLRSLFPNTLSINL